MGGTNPNMADFRSLRRTPSQETLMSLLQLDPNPMPDTEKDLPPLPEESSESSRSIRPGHARTTSLGLSGSGQGSLYYRTPTRLSILLTLSVCLEYLPSLLTNASSSHAHTTILNLRPLHIYRPPPHQHLHNTPNYPRRPRLRVLPPPCSGDIPDAHDRASLRCPSHRCAHRLRHRIAHSPALPQPEEIRRRHTGRLPTEVIHRFLCVVKR